MKTILIALLGAVMLAGCTIYPTQQFHTRNFDWRGGEWHERGHWRNPDHGNWHEHGNHGHWHEEHREHRGRH